MPAAIEISGLVKRYGDVEAVRGIDLTIDEGEVFALLGPKAYHAARSGVEWAIHAAMNAPGSCPVGSTTTNSFDLTEGGLEGFRVTTECTSEIHTEAGAAETVFLITSLAERGVFGERDYVSRRLETRITNAP